MILKNKTTKLIMAMTMAFGLNSFILPEVNAQRTLQGNVSKEDTILRLARPTRGAKISRNAMPPKAPPIRLQRSSGLKQGTLMANKGQLDISTFKNDFKLKANASGTRMGIAKPGDFFSKNKFDLGTERNSRELRVAWERWHKQFSKAIYDTWSAVADEPGKTTLRVMVRKNRTIEISVVNSEASGRFNRQLKAAIKSLEGNPGLTFPTKSRRQFVSFEADYIAARNVRPGYSWVKDDYETVREHF